MIIRHTQLKSHTNMRNIQVCHDVGTLCIDRDGTTVLLEIRVYHYLSLLRLGTRLMCVCVCVCIRV